MLSYLMTSEGLLISGLSIMLLTTNRDSKKHYFSYFVFLVTLIITAFHVISTNNHFNNFLVEPLKFGIESPFIEVLGYIFAVITGFFFVRDNYEHKQEGLMLLLIACLGFSVLVNSHHLLTIYIGMELISFPLYTVVALSGSGYTIEAAFKYFIQGSFASTLFLFGVSILYGLHGSSILDITVGHSGLTNLVFSHEKLFLLESFALVLMSGTVFFKLGLVPFHFWVSDVYLKARPSLLMFLGTIPKIAFFTLAYKLIVILFVDTMGYSFQGVFIFLVIISSLWANTIALESHTLGRILGYSAIVQMSFLLLILLLGVEDAGSFNLGILHLVVYGVTTSIVFGIFVVSKVELSQTLDSLNGFDTRHPLSGLILILSIFSLAGIPPLPGFITKFLILKEVVAAGFYWTAGFVLASTIVACAYYIRIIKHIFRDKQTLTPSEGPVLSLSKSDIVITSLFVILVCFTINPTGFLYIAV